MKVAFKNTAGTISVTYAADIQIPPWFIRVFEEVCKVYYFSALKPRMQDVSGLPTPLVELLKLYNYEMYLDDFKVVSREEPRPITGKFDGKLSDEKVCLFFTGGLDSFHALMRLIESGVKKENILCLYITNVNRATSIYEKTAVSRICARLGVKSILVQTSLSIRPNYEGHNIGLREQLSLSLGLPYILKFGAKKIYFGLYKDFVDIETALVTSNQRCFNHLCDYLRLYGVDLEVSNHPDWPDISEMEATRDTVQRFSEWLPLIESCYCQQNWREQNHDRLAKQFPELKIYHGCGSCIKCIKINAHIRAQNYPLHAGLAEYLVDQLSRPKFSEEENRDALLSLISKSKLD